MVRLTEAQKHFFKDNGYILLKNILTEAELNELSDEYNAIFNRKNQAALENSWVGSIDGMRETPTTGVTVKGVHNLQHHHAAFTKYLLNENLLDAVEDVMGSENIMLHHTKAHFKPPEKGAAYPMHQDYHYFPYENDSPIAAFLNLDASGPENGGLVVYPGSHKLGPLEDVGPKDGDFHYMAKHRFPLDKATPVRAERGDIVLFSYLLVHGSPPNTSDRPRRMFLSQFISADDRQVGEQPTQPSYGLMLRGVNLSKLAAVETRFSNH